MHTKEDGVHEPKTSLRVRRVEERRPGKKRVGRCLPRLPSPFVLIKESGDERMEPMGCMRRGDLADHLPDSLGYVGDVFREGRRRDRKSVV